MKKSKFLFVLSVVSLSLIQLPLYEQNIQKEIVKVAAEEKPEVTDHIELRVMNMEDYIYEQDIEGGYEDPDLVEQFAEYCAENTRFKDVEVIYDTTDTNETLLSQLQTGKARYDLICPSEYMISKMVNQGLIQELHFDSYPELTNYDTYASKYIRSRLDNIQVNDVNGNQTTLGKYAVGYMWGTLGLLFNPDYNNYDPYQIVQDMQSWDVLWNPTYNGTISIKDSMRDTYFAAIMELNKEELRNARQRYVDGEIGEEEYNLLVNEYANQSDEETVKKVESTLNDLRGNIFGLEVDSGKSDIIQGKIGINLAWSGDAVYSMDLGYEEDINLAYAIPLEGANVWFDGWVMPSTSRSDDVDELAHIFLDYLSSPEIASLNMDYIGYTSFIGGDEVLELVNDWYGVGEDDEESDEEAPLEDEDEEPSDDEDDELIAVDLNYFFNNDFGTEDYEPNEDYIIYTDEYFYVVEDDEGNDYSNIAVGGQFFTQYPDYETIVRCGVMRDYGENNENILKMWERFKSTNLPTWAIVLLTVEVAGIIFGIGFYFLNKRVKYQLRKKREQESK